VPEGRLLFIHALAPPTPGGTPVIVRRLLSAVPGIEIDTVTDLLLARRVRRGEPRLPGPYHYVLKLPPLGARWTIARRIVSRLNVLLAWAAGARAALIRADWVLSVADHGFSVIAGDVCARLRGVPHVIWVFDLWEENAYSDVDRRLAARLEGRLWRRAAAIIGHAEEISRHYERKHGVPVQVLPTPIELADPAPRDPEPHATKEVLYAGALYWAQEEPLRRLAHVCRETDGVRLTIVGDRAQANRVGIDADAFEPRLAPEDFRARVARADVAFVGLSFDSPHPDVIATATPARLPEYMASGTPILVHAPAGSHVAEYARREDFAEVVDEPDPEALAAGLRRVIGDGDRSSMRVRRARELAVSRHDHRVVARALRELLDRIRNR
jgi:glycosyltransferase involved in cell wall biosynthesis